MNISNQPTFSADKGKENEIQPKRQDSRPCTIEFGSVSESEEASERQSIPRDRQKKGKRELTSIAATLEADIRHSNMVAVARVLGGQNFAMSPDGRPQIDVNGILGLFKDLRDHRGLGYAEIVEALFDTARQCLHYRCSPARLAKMLGPISDSAELILSPLGGADEGDVSFQIRTALFLGEVVLDKVAGSLPLAVAGGVPNERFREKWALLNALKTRINALKIMNALIEGSVAWHGDAVATLAEMAEEFTQSDFGKLHSALAMVVTFCGEMGTLEPGNDAKDVLKQLESTLKADGKCLAAKLDSSKLGNTAHALYADQLIKKFKEKQPTKTPSYWKYCCDLLQEKMDQERTDKAYDQKCINSSLQCLDNGHSKAPRSKFLTWRTEKVLDIAHDVSALSERVGDVSGDDAFAGLYELRRKIAKLHRVDETNRVLVGTSGVWLNKLDRLGLLPKTKNGTPRAKSAVLVNLRMHKDLLTEMVGELKEEERRRLADRRTEIADRMKVLRKRPLEKLRFKLAVQVWEESLPPTIQVASNDKRSAAFTLAYSFVRDGACTYFGRWAISELINEVMKFTKANETVPDEIFDVIALLISTGLTAYGLHRMASIKTTPKNDHTQSTFGRILRQSAGTLPAVQVATGIGAVAAHRYAGGLGTVAYNLWRAGVWAKALADLARYLRQSLQTPLMRQTPNIPLLKQWIKNISIERIDKRPMPLEHQRVYNCIRDGGYTAAVTFLGGLAGQLDLQTLVYGLSNLGSGAGEAFDGAWPDIAKLIFVCYYSEEYKLVTKEPVPEDCRATWNHFLTQAGARSAFGGWVDIWGNISAMVFHRFGAVNPEAMRALPFVGGFILGLTTAPRNRNIDDLKNPEASYVTSSGLGTWIIQTLLRCIPPAGRRYDAHVEAKLEERFHVVDTTIGRAAYQTAAQFRTWVDDFAKQIEPSVGSEQFHFATMLQQHWNAKANPLARVTDPGEMKALLESWWREAKSDSTKVSQCRTIRALLRTTASSPVSADSQPLVMQPVI
jgi:hypothetical protein